MDIVKHYSEIWIPMENFENGIPEQEVKRVIEVAAAAISRNTPYKEYRLVTTPTEYGVLDISEIEDITYKNCARLIIKSVFDNRQSTQTVIARLDMPNKAG